MPDMFGVRLKCSFLFHEGHYQDSAVTRSHVPCGICLHWQHLCQPRYWACDLRQWTFGSVLAGAQRPRTVGGRRMGAGINGCDGGSKEAWFQTFLIFATHQSVLFVWEVCRVPPGVWLASCGLRNTQKKS